MNKNLKSRKNYYKKGTGFSKYDKNGNVIYSESIGNLGETVRHFYFYDDCFLWIFTDNKRNIETTI